MTTIEEVRGALESVTQALASDGYELTPEMSDPGAVTLRIVALDGACEDCLVPKTLMVPMIEGLFKKSGLHAEVSDIVYPEGSIH